jgi:hypothetical protein
MMNPINNKTIVIVVAIIIVLLLLTIGVYYTFFSIDQYTSILCKPTHFVKDFNMYVPNEKLPLSKTGNSFTYSLWINIQNVAENSQWQSNVNYKKPILYRYGSPNINYYPKDHNLQIQMSYKDSNDDINYYDIDLTTLPMQKWVNIIIILENRNIDIFIDTIRYRSAILPNVPFIFNRNVYMGESDNNFNGYVGGVKYYNRALKENDIANIYTAGL